MARKKKRGCLGMILGIGMSVAVVVVLGMVGTYGLKWKRSYEKRNEIPYQKVNLKETNPAQKYYYESLSEKDKVVYQEILQGVLDGNGEIYLHSADAKRTISCFNLCSMIIRRFSGVTEEGRQRFTKKEQKAILF